MKVSHESEIEEGGFADIVVRIQYVIRRRWLTLVAVTLVVFALGAGLTLLMTPKYTAVANVRLDPSRNPVAAEQQNDSQALTPEAIETEVSLVKSGDVARAVVRKLNLTTDSEFANGLDGDTASGAPMSAIDRETAVASNVLAKLDVSRDKLSYLLGVGFTSRDRLKAAAIANAFAEQYIYAKVGSKSDAAAKKAAFLKQQLADLNDNIHRSEAQLAAYQGETGITSSTTANGSQGGTIIDQQIQPLSMQLAQAKSDAASASAILAAAESQASRGGADTVSDVLASPVIGQLRSQRAQVLQSMGEVMARYGEKHPETIRVRGQLADIDSQLKAETNRIMSSLRSKATAAEARAASLQSSMDGLAGRQAVNARNAVLAKSLDAEVQTERAQYDKLSQTLLEATQAANNSISQAEIVDSAKPPVKPTSPNKPVFFALALLVALAAGAGTIAVQELMVTGLRSVDDIESRLGLPMLAAIPREKSARPADLLLDKPTSLFAESFRIARASILGVRSAKPPQIIAITSALPSEGKTTTALAFARTLAINGQKTLLIDCDVRRAVMRQSVRDPSDGPGIVEVLDGLATVDQAIHPGDVDKLDHLLVRAPFFSSGNLFGDGKMEQILTGLRQRYELIVLDLPPLMGLADGRFLAALADTVAMVVRWDVTPAPAAASAVSSLQSDGANVAGVIFTMVDSGAEAVGGLYYSKKYSGYYQNG